MEFKYYKNESMIIMDYYEGGDLKQYIAKKSFPSLIWRKENKKDFIYYHNKSNKK